MGIRRKLGNLAEIPNANREFLPAGEAICVGDQRKAPHPDACPAARRPRVWLDWPLSRVAVGPGLFNPWR